jgi:hypothetical protein
MFLNEKGKLAERPVRKTMGLKPASQRAGHDCQVTETGIFVFI